MFITSRFNPKGLQLQLVLFLTTALALCTPAFGGKKDVIITIAVAGVLLAIAACIWAFLLKTITVMDQELEVKHTCLPFLKRYYRLAEFDSFIIEEDGIYETIFLLIQGKRAVKLSSKIYKNYAELKEVLSVVGLKEWGTDANRAVDSVFAKSHLAATFVLFLLVLLFVAIPIIEYVEDGQVTKKSYLLVLTGGLMFVSFFLYALSCCKRLTVWRGHLEVRSLLTPWKVDYYSLDDFDFALEVVTPSHFEEEKSLWLVRDNKLALSIPKNVYANYDVLEHAIGIVPSDTIKMSYFKKLKYHLGNTIDF